MSATDASGIAALPRELQTRERWLDPFDWYREMRESDPVRHDPERRCWDVFRYEDVKRVLADDAAFSVDPSTAADSERDDQANGNQLTSMLTVDPPRHDKLRSMVEDAFKPRALTGLEPRIRALAREYLDEAIGSEDTNLDVVSAIATPLPVTVIAELLGVPPEDRQQFKAWSDETVRAANAQGDPADGSCGAGPEAMTRYFLDLIPERRANPGDDLLSTLVTAKSDEGRHLTRQEVLGTCILLLVAGNITTTNLIANAVRCFIDQDLWADLSTSDALATAIEEVLRFRSPVQAMTRFATRDVSVGGEEIEAGDRIVVWLGSANRDPRKFDEPDRFLSDRAPNQHLAFGHGTHYCLGAPLARLEADIALSELLSRFASIDRVDEPLTPVRSAFVFGVESLPIRYRLA